LSGSLEFSSDWIDDEQRDLALEDLGKARDAIEMAWPEHGATKQ
jgi:hypothetical protein